MDDSGKSRRWVFHNPATTTAARCLVNTKRNKNTIKKFQAAELPFSLSLPVCAGRGMLCLVKIAVVMLMPLFVAPYDLGATQLLLSLPPAAAGGRDNNVCSRYLSV